MHRPGIPGTILATVVIAVALPACQTDQVDDAVADTEMDAQHEEDDGDAGHEIHWSYEGDTGPAMWGSLDPSFAACDDGVRQSPVDITGAVAGGESELEIRWQPGDAEVVDNGHTIVVNVAEGSAISLEGREFSLLQFHFHHPSEHTVEGSAAPIDIHFVHAAAEGDLAVIGVFLETGEADPTIQSIWEAIPSAGEPPGALAALDPRALLPEGGSHYRYPGSLTTPGCSEIVSWVVMTESIAVSQDQIDAFAALYPMNARPVQPLNERTIERRD